MVIRFASQAKSETGWKKHAYFGLPWWLRSKESGCNAGDAGDVGSIPTLERSSGVGNGNPLKYSCLGNPMDRGASRATVHRVAKRVGHDVVTKQAHMFTNGESRTTAAMELRRSYLSYLSKLLSTAWVPSFLGVMPIIKLSDDHQNSST